MLAEVTAGLSLPQKTLPSKFFYDERGSQLFDEITGLDEYYLTRAETALMQQHGPEIARLLGPGCLLIEYGSGSSVKTRILLDHVTDPAGYMPIDISTEHLLKTAEALQADYPDLPVMPVSADFTASFELPDPPRDVRRRVVYFPGSTIGNFTKPAAASLLSQMARVSGPGGGVLVGVDLDKDPGILHAAYNDSQGVTAEFNLNILTRLNRELGAEFDLGGFAHEARYNREQSRIEMHLVSRHEQCAAINGRTFRFAQGETILTEYSHKYTAESFGKMAAEAGLRTERVWCDSRGLFSVQFLANEQ